MEGDGSDLPPRAIDDLDVVGLERRQRLLLQNAEASAAILDKKNVGILEEITRVEQGVLHAEVGREAGAVDLIHTVGPEAAAQV